MSRLVAGSATDVGMVRTNNEDNLLLAEPLFAVADGMGGHAAGEVASTTAVGILDEAFRRTPTAGGLTEAVREANRAVYQQAIDQPDKRGMGTTLTAAALVPGDGEGDDDQLVVVNVGDSRAYLLRDGDLQRLTEDHSVVEELIRGGRLSVEEAQHHPQRHVLTRVLGVDHDVDVDVFPVIPYRGDRVLLASDGLLNEVDDHEIADILRRLRDPDQAAAELVKVAKAHGGSDNITVVVIDVVDDDDRAKRASAALAAEPMAARPVAPAPPPVAPATVDLPVPDPSAAATSVPADAGARTANDEAVARHRRVTGRVVAFVLVLLLLLGAAGAAFWYFGRRQCYVGLRDQQVTIFRGRPGGLLWLQPTVAERTGIAADLVPADRRDDITAGKIEASLADARQYVSSLRGEIDYQVPDYQARAPATTTPTTTRGP